MATYDFSLIQDFLKQSEGGGGTEGDYASPSVGSAEDEIRKGILNYLKSVAREAKEDKKALLLSWCQAVHDARREIEEKKNKKKPSQTEGGEEDSRKEEKLSLDSLEEAKNYIGAFLRTASDTCVGGTLETLNVLYLRALCFMCDVQVKKTSKAVLYTALANYYYTECVKLKKRVPKTVTDTYETNALQSLAQKERPTRSAHHEPTTATPGDRKPKAEGRKATAAVATTNAAAASASAPAPPARRARAAVTTSSASTAAAPVDTLEIEDNAPVLKRARAGAAVSRPPTTSVAAGQYEEWSDARFCAAIIAAIRNDCSTPQDIAKGVRRLGYRGPDSLERVEAKMNDLVAQGMLYTMGGMLGLGEEMESRLQY